MSSSLTNLPRPKQDNTCPVFQASSTAFLHSVIPCPRGGYKGQVQKTRPTKSKMSPIWPRDPRLRGTVRAISVVNCTYLALIWRLDCNHREFSLELIASIRGAKLTLGPIRRCYGEANHLKGAPGTSRKRDAPRIDTRTAPRLPWIALVVAVEMSLSTWLVCAEVPGLERRAMKKCRLMKPSFTVAPLAR